MPLTMLSFVSPQRSRRFAQAFSAAQAEWCYLGWDPLQVAHSESACAHLPRVWMGEELNRTAHVLKQPFLDWLSTLGRAQRHPARWWSSRMASKSPVQTDLFLLMCYTEIVASWVEQNEGQRAHRIVVVEDPWLLWWFARHYRGHQRVAAAQGAGRGLLKHILRWSARVPWATGRFMLWGFATCIIYRLGLRHEDVWRSGPPARGALLYTWIVRGNLEGSGAFRDAYTGGLADLLTHAGYDVSRLTPLKIGARRGLRRQFALLAKSWIVCPRYLRLSDIIRAAVTRFSVGQLRSLSRWRGRSYALLVWREIAQEWGDLEFPSTQLWYRTVRRIARRHRHAVHLVVYPFENQPWEKLLCLAVRQEIPTAHLVGYQHAALSPLWLNYFFGQAEVGHAPVPDVVVTSGPMGRRLLIEGGFPAERVWQGGTFRFESLVRNAPVSHRARDARDGQRRVVVAFPISWPHAAELLQALLEAFLTPVVRAQTEQQILLQLKCHPLLPIHKLLRKGQRLPPWCAVADEPLAQLLPEADVFLYAPPTGSVWEAKAMGVPVLKYRGELFDFDARDTLDRDPLAECSRETLRQRVEWLLAGPARIASASDGQGSLQDVFSPVDDRVWLALATGMEAACA